MATTSDSPVRVIAYYPVDGPVPYFTVEGVPDAAFTMLSVCPHAREGKPASGITNLAVGNLLPPGARGLVGPIVVCKHEHSMKEVPDGCMTLLDVTAADLSLVNELVASMSSDPSSSPSSQRTRTRDRVQNLEDLVGQLQRQIAALELRHTCLAEPSQAPIPPPASHPAPQPAAAQTSVAASPAPPSVLSSPPSSSFPSSTSSSLTTGPSTSVSATADGVYVYSSHAQPPTHTTSWPEAHAGSQGLPGGHARHIESSPTPRRKHPMPYHVVFRGHEIGVFHNNWPRVQRALTGFRCAVSKGYDHEIDANTAFANAQRREYTSTTPQAVGEWAVALEKMPLPVQHDDPHVVGSERLRGRVNGEPWYVVFKGANPGVFPT
ncbi:hypothetical protein C8F01DRAFT_1084003 [Mycena amicta]|nr:hypothetical protein C8F01DRAFT_1084003 [Mycena amicta]